jgi:hypothetical protein
VERLVRVQFADRAEQAYVLDDPAAPRLDEERDGVAPPARMLELADEDVLTGVAAAAGAPGVERRGLADVGELPWQADRSFGEARRRLAAVPRRMACESGSASRSSSATTLAAMRLPTRTPPGEKASLICREYCATTISSWRESCSVRQSSRK